jgi:hypothetical protein
MRLIESKTLGTAQASIEFTSIPSTFTDLVFLVSAREATTNNLTCVISINGSTANLSQRFLAGNGSSASSSSAASLFLYIAAAVRTANTFGNASIYIPNYSSTTTAKSFSIDAVEEDNGTSAFQMINAGLWNSTTAINSVSFAAVGGNLAAGSMISLYGITKGSDGIVTTSP